MNCWRRLVLDDVADAKGVHNRTGDGMLDKLYIRGRHYMISTWTSTQKLRLMSSAVRVNIMFACVFRLRNRLELEALVEELSALVDKETLYSMYEEATREKYSFWYVNLLAPKEEAFWVRFERKFAAEPAEPQQPVNGRLPVGGGGQAAGGRAHHRERVQ